MLEITVLLRLIASVIAVVLWVKQEYIDTSILSLKNGSKCFEVADTISDDSKSTISLVVKILEQTLQTRLLQVVFVLTDERELETLVLFLQYMHTISTYWHQAVQKASVKVVDKLQKNGLYHWSKPLLLFIYITNLSFTTNSVCCWRANFLIKKSKGLQNTARVGTHAISLFNLLMLTQKY